MIRLLTDPGKATLATMALPSFETSILNSKLSIVTFGTTTSKAVNFKLAKAGVPVKLTMGLVAPTPLIINSLSTKTCSLYVPEETSKVFPLTVAEAFIAA